MNGVTITIDDDLLRELRMSSEKAEEQLRLELAAQLVASGIATPAQGARVAKLGRLDFLKELGRRHVSVLDTVEAHQEDVRVLRGQPFR